jgi:biopolymer transport protein TolQ
MFVNPFTLVLVSSPFYEAYIQSDFLGKAIFLSLIATSVISWTILIHKILLTWQVKKKSLLFAKSFAKHKNNPLGLENEGNFKRNQKNSYYDLYLVLKKFTVDILNKNLKFGSEKEKGSYLSSSDIDCIASHLDTTIVMETKNLESGLFILSTIVGLAPLLGLLGTVWGILTTFSGLQSQSMASSNQMVLGGISLALTTTVLGLVNAMPALIAYNYLKNSIRNFEIEMEGFANEMLCSVEMQYRKVDLHR